MHGRICSLRHKLSFISVEFDCNRHPMYYDIIHIDNRNSDAKWQYESIIYILLIAITDSIFNAGTCTSRYKAAGGKPGSISGKYFPENWLQNVESSQHWNYLNQLNLLNISNIVVCPRFGSYSLRCISQISMLCSCLSAASKGICIVQARFTSLPCMYHTFNQRLSHILTRE